MKISCDAYGDSASRNMEYGAYTDYDFWCWCPQNEIHLTVKHIAPNIVCKNETRMNCGWYTNRDPHSDGQHKNGIYCWLLLLVLVGGLLVGPQKIMSRYRSGYVKRGKTKKKKRNNYRKQWFGWRRFIRSFVY